VDVVDSVTVEFVAEVAATAVVDVVSFKVVTAPCVALVDCEVVAVRELVTFIATVVDMLKPGSRFVSASRVVFITKVASLDEVV
jgi:hypothetical protein